MTLSSITISGFKSFAKKTTIDISRNVTGIVGPNGSGKSNVAEAIRFVLGEQSMKSIRSKSMGDLIFKGSSTLGSLSRASVSITIDNKGRSAGRGVSEELAPFLAYDEIVLSREVYIDGGSTYKINNTDVRLKDVQAILALAGIGTSVHTIISQGEADRILLVSAEDRKDMIQDALGLRVHEMRLKESERKLLKVEEHMKTVSLMRRELAPELNHLKIQIEKIDKIEGEREKLFNAYLQYFLYENNIINSLKQKMSQYNDNKDRLIQIENEKQLLVEKESKIEDDRLNSKIEKSKQEEERYSLERSLAEVVYQKNILKNELEKIPTHASISKADYQKFKDSVRSLTDKLESAVASNNTNEIKSLIHEINNTVEHQFPEFSQVGHTDEINRQIAECVSKERDIQSKIESLKSVTVTDNNIEVIKEIYNKRQELDREVAAIEKVRQENEYIARELEEKDRMFAVSLQEATIFVGQKVLAYRDGTLPADYNHYNNQKALERSKIRIEEMGVIDIVGIKMQYEEMNARNTFLENEINDLNKTKESLDTLIADLRATIKTDFEKGLEKINFTFANFFHNIFPGGKAKLILTETKLEKEDGDDSEEKVKVGVELDISLPEKKVKDINMLSGGEKTLSSIALLFALTSIVPPPFMVLDETDAALDESNARKYGKLLSKLAEKSRLLVITHNRETMNQCDILYGITLGGDGGSRILSIKFDK